MEDCGNKLGVYTVRLFLTYPYPEVDAENVQDLNSALSWAIQSEHYFLEVSSSLIGGVWNISCCFHMGVWYDCLGLS